MKRLSALLLALYAACFLFDVWVSQTTNESLRYVSKGLLMPLLAILFYVETKKEHTPRTKATRILIFFALLFSLIGDSLLIHNSALNFMAGIGAFLIAQILYVTFFSRLISFPLKNKAYSLFTFLVVVAYVVTLLSLFWNKINAQQLTIPVNAYSYVLGFMLLSSLNTVQTKSIQKIALYYFIPGAIIFVASDSMIGLNQFYLDTPLSGFYIMLTYCIAQCLLILGAIRVVQQTAKLY